MVPNSPQDLRPNARKLVADKWGKHSWGAAAKVMDSDRLGKQVGPGTFGSMKIG